MNMYICTHGGLISRISDNTMILSSERLTFASQEALDELN
jgi:hypothetical protein